MGKGAYIRIQNKSTTAVAVAVQDRTEIDETGMDAIQTPVLEPGQQLPHDNGGEVKFSHGHKYQYLEGEKKVFFQKDGSFKLVVGSSSAHGENDTTNGDMVKLCCNASDWWFEPSNTSHGATMVKVATDVEEEDDIVRIEIRIYDGFHTKSWMSDLADAIEGKPLCAVGIPGTHDSATYQWDENAGASPDSSLTMGIQSKLEGDDGGGGGGFLGKIGGAINDHILGQVFDKICRCQDKTIKEQLEAGIRYLDIRVAFHEDSGRFYTCHGVHCVDVNTVTEEVNAFLTESPKEIVIFDINHLYNMDEHHKELLDNVLATLGDKVADYTQVQPQSTIGEYWAVGAQAVVLYRDAGVCNEFAGKVWAPGLIRSPWPESNDTVDLHDKLQVNVTQRETDKFFVLQGILTPDGDLIKEEVMESNVSTSLESIAKRVSPKVVDWVEDEWSEEAQNIVIVDFFENCSMVASIINWNRK